MSDEVERQNRFLRRARISEVTFAKIIYLWICGETYSSIPEKIENDHEALEHAVEQLYSLDLSHVGNTTISRQALHAQINAAATKVNVMVYVQRVELLKDILFSAQSDGTRAPPFALRLIADREDTTAETLLEEAQNQSVSEFIQAWGKVVYLVSSNQIPYGAMRAINGVKPFDAIMSPIIVDMMRTRYDKFRGYKLNAMQTHIAHHFALRMGLENMRKPYERQQIILSATSTALKLLSKFEHLSE